MAEIKSQVRDNRPNFIAWSHSRLKTFKECPKQFYHLNVPKRGHPDRVEFVQSKAMLDGNEVDNALTARIASGTALPEKFAPYEGMAQAVLAAPGAKLTQAKFALDQSFRSVGYSDWDNAWVRVIYDVAVVNPEHLFVGDWKNGQIWPDEAQLRLFATVGFHIFPEVQTIHTSYIWLKHGITSDETYQRRDLPDLWQTFLPDVERLQVSSRTNHWPATPSKRGCKRCPVGAAGRCDQVMR